MASSCHRSGGFSLLSEVFKYHKRNTNATFTSQRNWLKIRKNGNWAHNIQITISHTEVSLVIQQGRKNGGIKKMIAWHELLVNGKKSGS